MQVNYTYLYTRYNNSDLPTYSINLIIFVRTYVGFENMGSGVKKCVVFCF